MLLFIKDLHTKNDIMVMNKDVLFSLTKGGFAPQEEMLEVARKKGKLYIGIPKEIAFQENRVALVPDAVALIVNNGHRVVVETNAGKAANFEDTDYSEAGAEIVLSPNDVYKADTIFKIAPPTLEEIELMQPKQTLFSALQLTVQPQDFLKKLISKKLNCVAFDLVLDDVGIFPIIRAMGEIAGGTSISIAAELLSNVNNGVGLILGGISGISPTEVIIIGAGNLGQALANYVKFEKLGFVIVGLFDVNPELCGKSIRGNKIEMIDKLEEFVKKHKVDIATLTMPKEKADAVANQLVSLGVHAIWNFAHVDLEVLDENVVVENVHLSDSLMQLSYNMTKNKRKKETLE